MRAVDAFLSRLQTLYGPPDSDDPAGFISEYSKQLVGYPTHALAKAADLVIKNNRFKSWPTVGECVRRCEEVIESEHVGKVDKDAVAPSHPEWTRERIEKANRMIACELGRRAADEGWIRSLWDFCREKQRLPGAYEIGDVIAKARGFDDAFRACRMGGGGELGAALASLGASMLARRQESADIANGGRG